MYHAEQPARGQLLYLPSGQLNANEPVESNKISNCWGLRLGRTAADLKLFYMLWGGHRTVLILPTTHFSLIKTFAILMNPTD